MHSMLRIQEIDWGFFPFFTFFLFVFWLIRWSVSIITIGTVWIDLPFFKIYFDPHFNDGRINNSFSSSFYVCFIIFTSISKVWTVVLRSLEAIEARTKHPTESGHGILTSYLFSS